MPAYLIARIEASDPTLLKNYQAATPSILAKYRGKFLARGGRTVTLEGESESRRIVIMEFADLEAAEAYYRSPEYQAAKQLRDGVAIAEFIAVDGVKQP